MTEILHVDVDAFFASVEVLKNPNLREKPVIVGGLGPRGVVAAATYEARIYGIRSAMPIFKAKQLCPGAIFIAPDMKSYRDYSARLSVILNRFTPLIEFASLEEAYMDVTGAQKLFGSSYEIAKRIRREIYEELGLTASIGIAEKKFIAKIASKTAKPKIDEKAKIIYPGKGIVEVKRQAERGFLADLSVRMLPGIGPKLSERLKGFGIHKIKDLEALELTVLEKKFGKAAAAKLYNLCRGNDGDQIISESRRKSVSIEQTFSDDVLDPLLLHPYLKHFARVLSKSASEKNCAVNRVFIKIKFSNFEITTKNYSFNPKIPDYDFLYEIALRLLERVNLKGPVRLIGLGLTYAGSSQVLFGNLFDSNKLGLSEAVGRLNEKYGDNVVTYGGSFDLGKPRGRDENNWG
jgi:DNA polymerase-4